PSINGAMLTNVGNLTLFRYCFSKFEILTGGDGISANLKQSPWLLMVVPLYLAALIFNCRKIIKEEKTDVIHSHWIIPQGLAAVICRGLFRIQVPIVVTSHGGDLFGLKSAMMTSIKRFVLARADHVTVVSRAMKTYCIRHLGCDPDKISVRSMGVDLKKQFVPSQDRPDPLKLVFVGRLVEKKGADILIRAMRIILAEIPDARLDIFGDGPELEPCKNLANDLKVSDHIRFHGAEPNSRVHICYQKAGIAVMPFRIAKDGDQEGLGLTTVEAIGCGCSVVASNLVAVRDVIEDGQTGFLVTPEDPKLLANKIISIIKALTKSKILCPGARQQVLKKFDWDIVAKDYAAFLSNATALRP
ncbi:MAG: glycosyltransferase family 4 protein, partial [Desulfobacterales bacterium]|nr:glycosyltransferase family 4 protein [Desulfobacterales bacterium]